MEIADDAHGQSFSAARSRFSKMRRKPLRFTSFGIMNLVVGVIVENTLAAARDNDEKVQQRFEE